MAYITTCGQWQPQPTRGIGAYGAAINAGLKSSPKVLAFDSAGNLFIADNNNRVRKVDTSGIITTVAGNGVYSSGGGGAFSGDGGAATNASLYRPNNVAFDAAGNWYIADIFNQRIRRVDTNGIITTVAGNGTQNYSGDGGAATNASMHYPASVALDVVGNLYIADLYNYRIRKVNTNNIITTFAGNGNPSFFGDGGKATNASIYNPQGVAFDAAGNLYIADTYNNRIRKVGTNGIITTVSGKGSGKFAGDGGAATNAYLNEPWGVVLDSVGNMYIADYGNNRIRKVDTNGIITTVAGNGSATYAGDGGAATNASLNNPACVALDNMGNLFIADWQNNRVREVHFAGMPTFTVNNVSVTNAGNYRVVVTGASGSVTSLVVSLTVISSPTIKCCNAVIRQVSLIRNAQTNFGYQRQYATNLERARLD